MSVADLQAHWSWLAMPDGAQVLVDRNPAFRQRLPAVLVSPLDLELPDETRAELMAARHASARAVFTRELTPVYKAIERYRRRHGTG